MVKRFAAFLWMTPALHLSPQIYPHTLLAKEFSLISKTYRFPFSCVSLSRIIKPFQEKHLHCVILASRFLAPWLALLIVDCVGLYWNKLAASLSINQCIVGRSPAVAFLQLEPDTKHCDCSKCTDFCLMTCCFLWSSSLALWHRELDTAV